MESQLLFSLLLLYAAARDLEQQCPSRCASFPAAVPPEPACPGSMLYKWRTRFLTTSMSAVTLQHHGQSRIGHGDACHCSFRSTLTRWEIKCLILKIFTLCGAASARVMSASKNHPDSVSGLNLDKDDDASSLMKNSSVQTVATYEVQMWDAFVHM